MLKFNVIFSKCITLEAVILFSLRSVSLMHKNPQRYKIIRGMSPVECKDRSLDLKVLIVEYSVHVISVAVIVVVV